MGGSTSKKNPALAVFVSTRKFTAELITTENSFGWCINNNSGHDAIICDSRYISKSPFSPAKQHLKNTTIFFNKRKVR